MFTGIVAAQGEVRRITQDVEATLTIGAAEGGLVGLVVGGSIACNGVCLTATAVGPDWFTVQASAETLAKTTLAAWGVGTQVNLERPLRAGDELGGHLVAGHVDGVAELTDRMPDGESLRLTLRPPRALLPLIAPKGSVTLDGVSLTVNSVLKDGFEVNIIPHTQTCTNLGSLAPSARLNLEVDLLARYLARLLEAARA